MSRDEMDMPRRSLPDWPSAEIRRQFEILAKHLPGFERDVDEVMAAAQIDRPTALLHCANAQLRCLLETLTHVPELNGHLMLLQNLNWELGNALAGRESPLSVKGLQVGRKRMSVQSCVVKMLGATALQLLHSQGNPKILESAGAVAAIFSGAGLVGKNGGPLTAQTIYDWHVEFMGDPDNKECILQECASAAVISEEQAISAIRGWANTAAGFATIWPNAYLTSPKPA